MHQTERRCVDRRRALVCGLQAGVGVAAWLVARPAHAHAELHAQAAPVKLSKESVRYTDAGNVEGKDCDDCSQYVAPSSPRALATCKLVEGPISRHGHCIAFSPKAT